MRLLCFMIFFASVGADISFSSVIANESSKCNQPTVTVMYTVWVGSDVSEQATIAVTAPQNSSFYEVMKIAMGKDSFFTFKATTSDFGHYITSIGGHQQDTKKQIYWWIYTTMKKPDPSEPPTKDDLSKFGVDNLFILDGFNYLFWLRHLEF